MQLKSLKVVPQVFRRHSLHTWAQNLRRRLFWERLTSWGRHWRST